MKKSLLVLSVFMTACTSTGPTVPPPTIPVSTPPTESTDAPAFHSADYGLSVDYSTEWTQMAATDQPNAYVDFSDATKGEETILRLELSNETYADTNFEVTDFSISAVPAASQEACFSLSTGDNRVAFDESKNTVINGVTYYTSIGGEGAMSHNYTYKYFRTFKNETCFSIQETVGVINMGVYDSGTVTEVDKDALWSKLDTVLQTVKFQ